MALRIRLQRTGTKNKPNYRVVVAEKATRRDGRSIEILGNYDPRLSNQKDRCRMKLERYDYWVGVGAQPSETVNALANKLRATSAKA